MLPGSARYQVALLLAAAVLAGCHRDDDYLSDGEMGWLTRHGEWAVEFGAPFSELERLELSGGAYADPTAIRALIAPLAKCEESFDDAVGDAPDRLRAVHDAMIEYCRWGQRWAKAHARSYSGPNPQEASVDAAVYGTLSARALTRAWEGVHVLLRASRPLRRVDERAFYSRIDVKLSAAASRFAGRPIEVRCWSQQEWRAVAREYAAFSGREGGGFPTPSGRINLHPGFCERLGRFAYAGNRAEKRLALPRIEVPLVVLAHETEHVVAPWGTEARTECVAIQKAPGLARVLGLPGPKSLAKAYYDQYYVTLPTRYRSPECRNGGLFDIQPGKAEWP